MPGPDTVVEELPVIELGIAGLVWAVVFVVSLALWTIWILSFGKIFKKIGGIKIPVPLAPDLHPLSFLEDYSNGVANFLQWSAKKSQHNMGYFFHAAATLQGWLARELVGLARDTLHWATWLQHSHLPRWVKALIYAAFPPLLLARLVKAAIAANLPHLGRTIVTRVEHTVTTKVVRIVGATAGAIALPLPWIRVFPRLRDLGRDLSRVHHRLRRLELLLGATGAAALLARALGVTSARCFRGGNVGKIARRLCGMDTSLIDLLLLDTLAVIGAVSVVEFAKDLEAIESEAVKILGNLIAEFPNT